MTEAGCLKKKTQEELWSALPSPRQCLQGQKGLVHLNSGSCWVPLWFAFILLMLRFPLGQTMPGCLKHGTISLAGFSQGSIRIWWLAEELFIGQDHAHHHLVASSGHTDSPRLWEGTSGGAWVRFHVFQGRSQPSMACFYFCCSQHYQHTACFQR